MKNIIIIIIIVVTIAISIRSLNSGLTTVNQDKSRIESTINIVD